jgi:hypothetical protein
MPTSGAMFDTAIPTLIILATMLAFFFHDMMWARWRP